jgi:hypothetical protein
MSECPICHGNGYIRDAQGGTVICRGCTRTAPQREREKILQEARALICGPRADDYGDVRENFRRIAAGWSEIFGQPVTAVQVALAMDWVKTSRLITTPTHRDSWLDKAGYSALGAECSQ